VATQEQLIRAQYIELLKVFKSVFPHLQPPEPSWWSLWLSKHGFQAILTELQDLSRHPLRDKFSTASIGRAMSARLREKAFERAVKDAPVDSPEPGAKS
jgi:hypothetical protein